jgi:hypothetical protein
MRSFLSLEIVAIIGVVILGGLVALRILVGLLLGSFVLFMLDVFVEGKRPNATSKGADGKASGKAAIVAALLGRLLLLLVVVRGRRSLGLGIAIAGWRGSLLLAIARWKGSLLLAVAIAIAIAGRSRRSLRLAIAIARRLSIAGRRRSSLRLAIAIARRLSIAGISRRRLRRISVAVLSVGRRRGRRISLVSRRIWRLQISSRRISCYRRRRRRSRIAALAQASRESDLAMGPPRGALQRQVVV